MKKAVWVIVLLVAVLFYCCAEEEETVVYEPPEVTLDIQDYIEGLSDDQTTFLQLRTTLLGHPVQDIIDLYGENYKLTWGEYYATLTYPQGAFSVNLGTDFEWYDRNVTDREAMEYLRYAVIENVTLDRIGTPLLDGISIGMTFGEIAEELGVDSLTYRSSSTAITSDYDQAGNRIKVYEIFGSAGQVDYVLVFRGDVLTSLELLGKPARASQQETQGALQLRQVFDWLQENGQASFRFEDLTYTGVRYESHYGSWFDSWQFTAGSYEDGVILVEQTAPYRICATIGDMPLLFWYDGNYVNPVLSFLGKWRDYETQKYLDIKSISREGIVVFDMYTTTGQGDEMVLLENLSTAVEKLPKTLDDCLLAQYYGETFSGEMQLYDGNVQSGCYLYGGDTIYLMDCMILDFSGSVRYLPTGMGGRIGTGTLPVHIPEENPDYNRPSSFGYMENFGRDDPNEENIMSTGKPAGMELLNQYLNGVYNTEGLQYADLDYQYLYDYQFPVNNVTYHVWQSRGSQQPHYLYVDQAGGMILQEKILGPTERHAKTLIYKDGIKVSNRSYAQQVFVTLDGKIRVDLDQWKITNADAFVQELEISEMGLDTVGENERFMFFITVGDRFAVNGYVLFDHTTWGATLHVTDSNMSGFPIGLHYLSSETFFLDPSVGVVAVPEEDQEVTIDQAIPDQGQETRLVIREYSGKILGYIYVDEKGNKTVREFTGKTLGYYYADRDVTTDFSGRVLARGDIASALLFMDD